MARSAEQELAKCEERLDAELLVHNVGIPLGVSFEEKLRWLQATRQWLARPLRERIREVLRRREHQGFHWKHIIGKWPGDETDEEIEEALRGLR